MTKKNKGFYWVTETFQEGEWKPGCKDYVGMLFYSRAIARKDIKLLKELFPSDNLKFRTSKYVRAQD